MFCPYLFKVGAINSRYWVAVAFKAATVGAKDDV